MTPLLFQPSIVTGFPIAPIVFPVLWLFFETSFIPRVRVGIPVAFPFLWHSV